MIRKLYTRVSAVFLTAGLLVAGLEIGAGLIYSHLFDDLVALIEGSPYFATRPWAKTYHEEFTRLTRAMKYHPYTIWRFPPFQGRYINTDEEGTRVTPGSCQSPRVWLFGGSTMWGFGAPDDGTIAAHVQRLAPAEECVRNFGQLGYTSTQGVITLESELRKGRRPRLVIFYDGVNDISAAVLYRQPGLHMFVPEVAEKLEHPFSIKNWMTWSNQFRLLRRLTKRLPTMPPQPDAIADMVVAGWLENYRIVQALATAYRFSAVFFWQPTVLTGRRPLLGAEVEPRGFGSDPNLKSLFQRVQERVNLRTRDTPGLYDLTGSLDGYRGHAYLDWHHLTPEANEVVAKTMFRTVGNQLVRSTR